MNDPLPTPILVSPGSQVLAVLLAGLLMTLSFQLLLTNGGVLISLIVLRFPLIRSLETDLGQKGNTDSGTNSPVGGVSTLSDSPLEAVESDSLVDIGEAIGFLAGLGILFSLLPALVPASFLAVTLSQIKQPFLGAIAGLVLWSAYILMLAWLSSQAMNSLIQIFLGGLVKGINQLLSATARLFPDSSSAAAAETAQAELEAAIASLNTRLEAYLKTLVVSTTTQPPDRVPVSQVARPEGSTFGLTVNPDQAKEQSAATSFSELLKSGLDQMIQQIDGKALLRQLLQQVDLLDWEIADLWQQVQRTQQRLFGREPAPLELLPEELETYLLRTPRWTLKSAALAEELPDLLYDPEADPLEMQRQLNRLSPDWFVQILQQRSDLSAEQLPSMVEQLDQLRQQALARCAVMPGDEGETTVAVTEAISTLHSKLTSYLLYTNLDKLTEAGMQQKLESLIAAMDLEPAVLQQAQPELSTAELESVLSRRQGLDAVTRQNMIDHLQTCWQSLLPSPSLAHQIGTELQTILADWSEQDTLTLEDLKPYLLDLMTSPQIAARHLGQSVAQLDWTPLQTVLMDAALDPEQIQAILQWTQQQAFQVARLPRRWLSRLGDQTQDWQTQFWQQQLQRYSRYQDKAALTAKQMPGDIQALITLWSWVPATAEISVEAIKDSLQSRSDLNSDEVETVMTSLQAAWHQIVEQADPLNAAAESGWDTLGHTLSGIELSSALPDLDSVPQQLSDLLAPLDQSLKTLSQSLVFWLPNSPLKPLRHYLQHWYQDTWQPLLQTRQDLPQTVRTFLEHQFSSLHDSLEQQLHQLERQALQQLNQLRRTAAMAAGWLVGISVTTAMGAALAGWLAATPLF
jgi:hypothetical protein